MGNRLKEVDNMVEKFNFGKGVLYGGILSLAFWVILFDTINNFIR